MDVFQVIRNLDMFRREYAHDERVVKTINAAIGELEERIEDWELDPRFDPEEDSRPTQRAADEANVEFFCGDCGEKTVTRHRDDCPRLRR